MDYILGSRVILMNTCFTICVSRFQQVKGWRVRRQGGKPKLAKRRGTRGGGGRKKINKEFATQFGFVTNFCTKKDMSRDKSMVNIKYNFISESVH